MVGRIDLRREFSFFSGCPIAQKIKHTIHKAMIDGRAIDVRMVEEKRNTEKRAANITLTVHYSLYIFYGKSSLSVFLLKDSSYLLKLTSY